MKILIVEDEAIIAMDLENKLEALGYRVAGIADNYEDAMAIAHATRPNLALLDINIFGDKDGVETAHSLWEELRIHALFLSAYPSKSSKKKINEEQNMGHINKPFGFNELKTKLKEAEDYIF